MGIRALAGRVNRACARPEEQLRGCESIAAQAHLLDGPNLGLVQLLQPIGDRVINLESIVGRKKGACRRESARRCGRDRRGGRCRRHANSSKRTSATISLDFFGIFSRSSQGCRRLLAWRNQRLLVLFAQGRDSRRASPSRPRAVMMSSCCVGLGLSTVGQVREKL